MKSTNIRSNNLLKCDENLLVSIIVPVFNIPKDYVEECIESIKHQSYCDIEIIIVDDGNTKEYAKWLETFCDDRTMVFHKTNGGVSSARNEGITKARGDYLYFCDPDDVMYNNEIETLLSVILEYKTDISVGGTVRIDSQGNVISRSFSHESDDIYVCPQSNKKFIQQFLVGRGYKNNANDIFFKNYDITVPWGKLYKKSIVQDILFPVDVFPGEDTVYEIMVMNEVRNGIAFIKKNIHYYRIGQGNYLKYSEKRMQNSIKATKLKEQLYAEIYGEDKNLFSVAEFNLLKALIDKYFFNNKNKKSYWERVSLLKSTISKLNNYKYFQMCLINDFKGKMVYLCLKSRCFFVFEIHRRMTQKQ